MKNIVKLGLIGAGAWGKNYIHTIEKIKYVEISCIASRNDNVCKTYSSRYKIFQNWKELIHSGKFDGLIIATPTDTHTKILNYCISQNIPTLIEKPLTKNLDEAEKIFLRAKNKNGIVLVDHIHLYHPSFIKLKEIYLNYGKICAIHSVSGGAGPYREDTRALWDWGTHDIAMCIDILKDIPDLVEANYLSRSFEKEKSGEIIQAKLISKNEIEINLIFGNLMTKKRKIFELHQINSFLRYQPFSSTNLIRENLENKKCFEEIFVEKKTPLTRLIETFRIAILNKETNLYDLKIAVGVTNVIQQISKVLEEKG